MSVCLYKSEDPFAGRRDQWWYVDAGTTISEACGGHNVRAWIGGREVSALFIERATLKDGVEVFVEPVPQASAVLAVAAAVASGAAASAGTWAAVAGYTALSIGLSVAGSLIAQSEAEQQGSTNGGIDRLNALTGQSNRIASYEPIQRLFGRMRYYPPVPMTAKPYTEIAGPNQRLRMLLVLNDGPMDIGGHIVGPGRDKITHETPLADTLGQYPLILNGTALNEFEDVEWEIGPPDQMTLYTDQVIETNPAWTTESDPGGASSDSNPTIDDNLSTVRTTEPGATGFSIDVSGNIYTIDSGGDLSKIRIQWMVEWRLSESSGAWESGTFTQQSDGKKTSRENFTRQGLQNDGTQTYDIRLKRLSTYFSNLEGDPASSVTWNALRTLRDRRAFTVAGTVVMALKIRATDQLDGTVDKLSVLGTAVVPVWDGSAWVEQPSRSPAWAFASLMTDQANRDPIPLSDFVLDSLVAWADEAEATGRYYDNVLDNNRTTIQRMEEISSAGRATWTIDPDTRIRIVRDTVQTVPKMVITPRNSYNYSYTLSAFSPPHAMRVRYTNAATWEPAERIVYDDGYDEGNATQFETIDAPGCTDSEQAWKHGRYVLARRRLRDIEKHAFSQDVQHFRYGRGDLLELAHDVILVGLAWGRVIDVTTNSEGQVTAITCDEFCPMEAATDYGVKIQRLDGTVAVVGVVNDAPGNQTLTLAEPVDDIAYDDHVAFGEAGKETIDVKLVSITPRGNKQANMVCEPAAPEILDAETGDIPAPPDDITVPPDPTSLPPNRPSIDDIISDETVAARNDDGSLTWRLAVNVSANSSRTPTARIIVQARADDALRYVEREAQDGIAYFDVFRPADTVTIRAQAIGPNGRRSAWAYVYDYTLVGRQPRKPTSVAVTRGTFEITLAPQGGAPASVYEFWRGAPGLAAADIEAQATKLGQGKTWTDGAQDELDPATAYGYYIRTINTYGLSDFYALTVTTKNEPNRRLEHVTDEILEGASGSNPFATLRSRLESAEGDFDQEFSQLRARLSADDLALELGFDGQDPGTVQLADGWRVHASDSATLNALGYVAALGDTTAAYGILEGTPGSWSLAKCWRLTGSESQITGSVQTAVDSGQVYVMCRFYDTANVRLKIVNSDPATDDGTLNYAFDVPQLAGYYELIIVAGNSTYAKTIPNWFDGYNDAVVIDAMRASDALTYGPLREYS